MARLFTNLLLSSAIVLSLTFVHGHSVLNAQSIPVGSLEEEQLRLHLLLNEDVEYSNINRPLTRYTYNQIINRTESSHGWWNRPLNNPEFDLIYGIKAGIHTPFVQNTINSRFPYGENNGAAWYGRGNNLEFSGGFYITSPYFTIDLHPHFIYQQNSNYIEPRFEKRTDSQGNPRYRSLIGTRIDAPYRFGPDPFSTLDRGNSSIRIHYNKFEAGLSNEPQWWGPASKYPLLMSNNAPGINHAFVGTRERFRIPYFGSIQFRWIAGYPEESDYYDGRPAGNTRFINSINAAYSPSFQPNLTFGFIRTYHMYESDGFNIDNVLVMFNPFTQEELVEMQGEREERQMRDQAITVYFQWLLPAANARIYGEFFREDHSWDFRDFLNQPHHNSAWAFGFEKVFSSPIADHILLNAEITNLTITQLQQVRPQDFYYSHGSIRHGHTNRGQLLGAAIGPGSNSQFLSVDGYRGNYKAGLFIQRVVENDNYHLIENSRSVTPSEEFGDYFRHRVNLNIGANFLYGPGPVYLHYKLIWTKAYNYGRFDYSDLRQINVTNYERNDLTNVQFQIGVRYVF